MKYNITSYYPKKTNWFFYFQEIILMGALMLYGFPYTIITSFLNKDYYFAVSALLLWLTAISIIVNDYKNNDFLKSKIMMYSVFGIALIYFNFIK